jgi:hypothetical protein
MYVMHEMTRLQLLLPESQDQRLRTLARTQGTTRAELIRRGIDNILRESGLGDDDPLLGLIGQAGHGGDRRASQEHDRLLAEAKLGRPRPRSRARRSRAR